MEMSAPKKDRNYDFISVLYHILQGCQTCGTYLQNAEKSGAKVLADSLHEANGRLRLASPHSRLNGVRAGMTKCLLINRTASLRESWSLYLPVNEWKKTLRGAHIALPCWKVRSPV